MTETRTRVRSHVEANPGVHFNAIGRDLDIATGQTQYHLRRLLESGSLRRLEVSGRTHYFPAGYSETEQAAIALLRRETTREIVLLLLDDEIDRPAELADSVGVARSTSSGIWGPSSTAASRRRFATVEPSPSGSPNPNCSANSSLRSIRAFRTDSWIGSPASSTRFSNSAGLSDYRLFRTVPDRLCLCTD